ncbi:NAD(P)-dependent dehydrogenase, short-chain alcohol dehydrogenase family [Limimonas halophila]|uniref:NAD(P)-dependent dehydrogenase, short-chain alcohol dehydrogenase family n=1 Tax=Limimonas halophila TaxID=1082479 RepID=A0A1G7QI43_9PROT|nr:SDR family NAD(P)-dependent oxidoreductase [Limimonas halophila]SDF98182.1 NAD(P)-dependent dehydrogenase, short-chain alcohol dehydrogenase family [Limimonas halophila]
MDIDGRTFLVTGGASGLGAATARALVARGGAVVLGDVDTEGGAALAAELGNAARFVRVDVSREADAREAVDTAFSAYGALHGAFNCAGVVASGRVLNKAGEPHDLDAFAKTVNVNLVGSFNVARLAAAAMADNAPGADGERGVIVNTASIAAYDGQIGQTAYAASKGGVAAMTLPLARDLSGRGIRVVTIAPGIFDTPMMASLPDKVRQSLAEQTPFPQRLGLPEEYASLALHLLTNVMLNGEVIRLDGAVRMGPR